MVKSVLVIVLFGLIAVTYVSAVSKCYICDSEDCETPENEKTCTKEDFQKKEGDTPKPASNEDPEDKEDNEVKTTTAASKKYNCFKVLTKIDGKTKVKRGCTEQTSCENVKFGTAEEASCMICNEDGCNSASNIQRFAMAVVVFIASAMMLL